MMMEGCERVKYKALDNTGQKELLIESFEGGLNTSVPPNCIEDNELSDALNMWYRDGFLQKRPGLTPDISSLIWQGDVSEFDTVNFRFFPQPIFYEGKEYRIFTVVHSDIMSFERHYVFLINRACEIMNMGVLHFGRIDSTTFYLPESINFFSGKSNDGIGIYAFVTLYNSNGSGEKEYHIYEATGEESNWIITKNYYIPTVYVNGRGDNYEYSQPSQNYFSEQTPFEPESVNMIDGSFRAYFSSDGYSSVFRLPLMDIDPNAQITCRVYHAPDRSTWWIVEPGKNEAVCNQYETPVTLTVDRLKGVLKFTSDGIDHPISYMNSYKYNNICVTSCVRSLNKYEDIVSSTQTTKNGEHLLFSGGKDTGRIYCAKNDKPLYFPSKSSIYVGDCNERLCALSNFKGETLCFKENRIYRLNIKSGKKLEGLFTDIITDCFEPTILSADCISENIGSIYPDTICNCHGSLFFLSGNGVVYKMDSLNSEGLKEISFKIKDKLSTVLTDGTPYSTNVFASAVDGNYMLFIGSKVFVLNCSIKGVRYPSTAFKVKSENCGWFYFEFPEDIFISGAFFDGKDIFFIGSDRKVCCLYKLDGDYDLIYDGEQNAKFPIKCSASTKLYSLGSILSKKFIEKVEIVALGDMEIKYLAPLPIAKYRLISEDFGDLFIPKESHSNNIANVGVRMFGVKIESDKKCALSSLALKYRPSAF